MLGGMLAGEGEWIVVKEEGEVVVEAVVVGSATLAEEEAKNPGAKAGKV